MLASHSGLPKEDCEQRSLLQQANLAMSTVPRGDSSGVLHHYELDQGIFATRRSRSMHSSPARQLPKSNSPLQSLSRGSGSTASGAALLSSDESQASSSFSPRGLSSALRRTSSSASLWLARTKPTKAQAQASTAQSIFGNLDLSPVVGEIALLDELGGGGGGSRVYRGSIHGLSVAVKVIQLSHFTTEEEQAVRREARLMQAVQHPNVVKYLGFAISNGQARIVVELFSSTYRDVLDEYWSNGGAVELIQPEQERWLVLHHVAKGLHCLHSNLIFHRDLKGIF